MSMINIKANVKVKKRKYKLKANLLGFLFASPWIIGFLIFGLYPILKSLFYSFTNFNVFMSPEWIGLDNYKDLFKDDLFFKSLFNTLYMTVIGAPINIVFGLITAMLLNIKVKGISIYRTIFFLPSIVPVVASTLMWVWIFNPQYGLLNQGLRALGLYEPNWLTNASYTKPALIIMGLWSTGTIMIIFLAALQDIPRHLYESAEIDGAGKFRRFASITLPGISSVMLYQIILSIINNFQYFTQAYIITGASDKSNVAMTGGPENSILFYALYLFHNAFLYLNMGKASAMAWILLLITGLVTWLLIKTSGGWVNYGEGGSDND